MKKIMLTFLMCLSVSLAFPQLNFTDEQEMYVSQIHFIGGTETSSIYVNSKYSEQIGVIDSLAYLKVPVNGGEPEFFYKENLKIDSLVCQRLSSKLVKDTIYEAYIAYQNNGKYQYETSIYLLRRNIKDFEIMGEPVFIGKHGELPYMNSYIKIFPDDKGLFVLGTDKSHQSYLKRMSSDLKEVWTKDLSSFYPKSGVNIVRNIVYGEEAHTLLFELNLKKCDDCGFLNLKNENPKAVIGLLVFDQEGERSKFIPTLEEKIVFTRTKYFYNPELNEVTGIYYVHQIDTSDNSINGCGYGFFVWDAETANMKESTIKELTFGNVLEGDGENFLAALSSSSGFTSGEKFPYLLPPKVHKLANGNYILLFNNLGSRKEDINYKSDLNSEIKYCNYYLCLGPKGEIKWHKFEPYLVGQEFLSGEVTTNLNLVSLGYGKSINYADQTNFSFIGNSGRDDLIIYSVIDLNTGKTITRKSINEMLATDKLNAGITKYNVHSGKFVVGIQNSSRKGLRKMKFATFDPTVSKY